MYCQAHKARQVSRWTEKGLTSAHKEGLTVKSVEEKKIETKTIDLFRGTQRQRHDRMKSRG